jgi:DNA-directed RNA polymerase specialized sigma24 family protein
MASYKEQYYSLEENEMQDLIARAKGTDLEAKEELLKVFNNFLTKYVSLLYHGRYNISDYDIRRFISLFVKDSYVRFALMKNNLNQAGYKHVVEVMRGIQYMARRYGEEEDIRHTVNTTFFQCIQRYERRDSAKGPIPFSGFLYSYFFYLLKKNVDTFLIDQLGRKTFPLAPDEPTEDSEDEKTVGFKADPVEYSLEQVLSADVLDDFWVMGEKVFPPFDKLTVQERQLLKWRYVENKRSSEISQKINEHPNTVREHLKSIKKKMALIIEETDGDLYKQLNLEKLKKDK